MLLLHAAAAILLQ